MVEHIDFLVEEPSVEAALRSILPKIIGAISFEVYPHQGKQDLLNNLPHRMRGYSAWIPVGHRIVVVVDRDDDNCLQLKSKLESSVRGTRLLTRSKRTGDSYQVLTRIAVEELEAWFFGDWNAVCQAYSGVNPRIPQKANYRDPDRIPGGTWEALERVLMRAGHFKSGLRKIEAARSIAEYMDPTNNQSRSFRAFRDALIEMTTEVN